MYVNEVGTEVPQPTGNVSGGQSLPRKKQIITLRQKTLNNGLEDSSWEATAISGYQIWIPLCTHRLGVYSLGVYSLGVYRSRATRFGSRHALTGWGPTVWGPTVWEPTVWGPTEFAPPDFGPAAHSLV